MAGVELLVAPPPTPNGDLHVGHLAGPYLAADIYKRYTAQRGGRALYTVSTDDHQTYVDTTAERLGMMPEALIAESRASIQASFEAYGIALDAFGQPDPGYATYVSDFFVALQAEGLVRIAELPVLVDRTTARCAVEAFVSGFCPSCLEPTSGGICEACGHPNDCVDLLRLDDRYTVRREPRLVLDLEPFRRDVGDHLGGVACCRPALKRLINALLTRPLKPFSLSYNAPRGVDATRYGLAGQRLNVWAEMYPGHMYWLTGVAGQMSSDVPYIQFIGFDNSYFYVFVHVALALAARRCGFEWPLPRAFITNQFYYLETQKFSTSKRHVVWARDLARECNSDLTRLFLALHGPEYQEATFSRGAFDRTTAELASKINRLAAIFNTTRQSDASLSRGLPDEVVQALCADLPLNEYSGAALARRAVDVLDYLAHLASCDALDREHIPGAVAWCLTPFCPRYADRVREQFELTRVPWNQPVAKRDVMMPEIEIRP